MIWCPVKPINYTKGRIEDRVVRNSVCCLVWCESPPLWTCGEESIFSTLLLLNSVFWGQDKHEIILGHAVSQSDVVTCFYVWIWLDWMEYTLLLTNGIFIVISLAWHAHIRVRYRTKSEHTNNKNDLKKWTELDLWRMRYIFVADIFETQRIPTAVQIQTPGVNSGVQSTRHNTVTSLIDLFVKHVDTHHPYRRLSLAGCMMLQEHSDYLWEISWGPVDLNWIRNIENHTIMGHTNNSWTPQ